MFRTALVAAAVLTAAAATSTRAQEGLATTSTIGGHNTIQQAPSGGTNGRPTGGDLGASGNAGQPTEEERQTEKHNDAATQICKGC